MSDQALSPDTDKRFVDTVIARRLVDADTVARLAREHERRRALGEAAGSLAEHLCARGVLDRRVAADVLRTVRLARSKGPGGAADASPPADGAPPRQVADYVLEKELGRGGMGSVWLGRHRTTGALRAVKLLDGALDVERLARFRREAEALARVGGDAVVPVHEIGVARGRIYFVMGLMSGSLAGRLAARGPSPWPEAVRIALDVARALDRCHAAGLVHRDLKPDNVLLDAEGRPCLADFGVARDMTGASLTETGTVLGTPVYMPPEQLEGAAVDARADIYALGALLHELVSGAPPFRGASLFEIFEAKKKAAHEPLPSGLPRALVATIERSLAGDPGARHASARELAAELEALLAGAERSAAERTSRVPLLLLVILAGLVCLALLGRAILRPRSTTVPPPPPIAPATPGTPTPPPAVEKVDPAALLADAERILRSKGPSYELALEKVKLAREALGPAALPPDAAKGLRAAVELRVEEIIHAPHVDKSEVLERGWRALGVARAIRDELGEPLELTPEIGAFVHAYACLVKREDRVEEALQVSLLAMESMPTMAHEYANWAIVRAEQARKHGGRLGPIARTVITRSCEVAAGNRELCRVRMVQFLGFTGERDAMFRVAHEIAGDRSSRRTIAELVRAIVGAGLAPPPERGEVDSLIDAAGPVPELLYLRGLSGESCQEDFATALEEGLRDDDVERAAAQRVGITAALRTACIERLFAAGKTERALLVFALCWDRRVRALSPWVPLARTPESQRALVRELPRR